MSLETKSRARRANSGCVTVKVTTRRAERMPRQSEATSEYRVDEHGALMIASAASCNIAPGESPDNDRPELDGLDMLMQPQWRARIHYDVYDHSFWFTPHSSCPAFHTPCSVVVPSRRRDIFVQLGERGSTTMSWPLQAGDGFRIGHTYVVVLRVLHHNSDAAGGTGSGTGGSGSGSGAEDSQHGAAAAAAAAAAAGGAAAAGAERGGAAGGGAAGGEAGEAGAAPRASHASVPSAADESDDGAGSARGPLSRAGTRAVADDDDDADSADGDVVYGEVPGDDGEVAECCFCYEPGSREDPLMRACLECRGSVQYVHLSCLRRWSSPQGSGRVPATCPTCKRDLRADVQEKLVMAPALLLEVYWAHHRQRRCQWVTFAARNTATIGKMEDNDIVIPDHTVSRRHARIEYTGGKFVLHDTLSSRGTFAPIRSPLKLAWGQEVCMTVGKSTLILTPKLSWLHYLTRWMPALQPRRGAQAAGGAGGAAEGADEDTETPPHAARRTGAAPAGPAAEVAAGAAPNDAAAEPAAPAR